MISRFFVENKSSKPNRFFLCFFSQDLTAEIADKSEEILLERQRNVNLATFVGEKYLENQNLAAKTEKNFYSKIWALLAWNIFFRPPRYFVAILLVLWSFFGI